jgi:hypothetical protein
MTRRELRGIGQRGQMMILATFGMVVLLGFVGLVIDVGRMYVVRQQLRNACDAAVSAAAPHLPLQPSQAIAAAYDLYCRNAGGTPPPNPVNDADHTIAGTGDIVHVTTPYQGHSQRLYCSARRTVPSAFMQLLGIRSQVVSAYAVGHQTGRATPASLLSSNFSSTSRGVSTQYINRTRPDGQRYAIVIDGNNAELGLDSQGRIRGIIATSQNIYVDSNNSVGKAFYGDTRFPNYGKGNAKTSPELLNPAPGAPSGMLFLDPNYYLEQAMAAGSGHVLHGNQTFKNTTLNGFYFVYGDVYIGKRVTGTATIAATGRIVTGETGQELTYADTENKLLFYAGADPSINPETYFTSPSFNPDDHYIHLNDNNCTYRGSMYAPYGRILVESNKVAIYGSIIGDTIGITQNANNLTVSFDPLLSPPVSPGMLLIE